MTHKEYSRRRLDVDLKWHVGCRVIDNEALRKGDIMRLARMDVMQGLGLDKGRWDGVYMSHRIRKSSYDIVRACTFDGPVGLYNLGNTCFMNVGLQCLCWCTMVRDFFLKDVGHCWEACELSRKDDEIRKRRGGCRADQVCLACELDKLYLKMFGSACGRDFLGGSGSGVRSREGEGEGEAHQQLRGFPVVPHEFLTATWMCGSMKHLMGYSQHDAQEWLQAFLDTLGKHLRLYQADRGIRKADIISQCFGGRLKSTLSCSHCGCERSVEEKFLNISVSVQPDEPSPLDGEAAKKSSSAPQGLDAGFKYGKDSYLPPTRGKSKSPEETVSPMTLADCLSKFTSPEPLTSHVSCENCRTDRPFLKRLTISSLPNVLCLHLKRFDASTNRKINNSVSFPALSLDMSQYLSTSEASCAPAHSGDGGAVKPPLYDLFAVINHKGSLYQGHYTCYVKDRVRPGNSKLWYCCEDSFISETSEEYVLKDDKTAYILFYEKRKEINVKK